MIIIDGHQSEMHLETFSNLEEILVTVMQDGAMQDRVVTDVMLNEEHFSEIYPHQAEDIERDFIQSVEIRTIGVKEMALSITVEMNTVCEMLVAGSRQVARLFRQSDDHEALEMIQNLLDVTRDFMSMISVLRADFSVHDTEKFTRHVETLSALLGEMSEVMEGEDWVLLADLLEYEFAPECEVWKQLVLGIHDELQGVRA